MKASKFSERICTAKMSEELSKGKHLTTLMPFLKSTFSSPLPTMCFTVSKVRREGQKMLVDEKFRKRMVEIRCCIEVDVCVVHFFLSINSKKGLNLCFAILEFALIP